MPLDLSALKDAPRLLIEAELKPLQGHTIYPTNFPNLGAATYADPKNNGCQNLSVESPQSMANLMEAACWDGDTWNKPLANIPYVEVVDENDQAFTWSTLEAHRLNSVYIEKSDWFERLKQEVGFNEERSYDPPRQLAPVLLKYDPNSLIHGVMLESIGGVVRLPRALGAFIESEEVQVAPGGGAKFDRNQPAKTATQTAKEGYGNVIYSRDRYAPKRTIAYFNLDLRQIRSYGIPDLAKDFLILFALYKIGAVLMNGCQRRRECEFDVEKIEVKGRGISAAFSKSLVAAFDNPEQLARETTEAIDKLATNHPDTLAPQNSSREGRRVTIAKYGVARTERRRKQRESETESAETGTGSE